MNKQAELLMAKAKVLEKDINSQIEKFQEENGTPVLVYFDIEKGVTIGLMIDMDKLPE
jgi:hypothetical protein